MGKKVDIVVNEDSAFNAERGNTFVNKIDVDDLADNIFEFLKKIQKPLEKISDIGDNVQVEKLVLNLGIGAKANISLLGTGVSGSSNASISVHLKLQPEN